MPTVRPPLFLLLFFCLTGAPTHAQEPSSKRSIDAAFSSIQRLDFELVSRLPHDPEIFTEGLEWVDERLVESSGLYGRSALILRKIAQVEPLLRLPLPADVFAEGLTFFDSRYYLLSWREQRALVLNERFETLKTLRYEGEGWGLTHDASGLIMSDGSARLTFRRADDFAITRVLEVWLDGQPLTQLNELEYAHGLVFANLWHSDRIVLIDPHSGQVRAYLDLSPLRQQMRTDAVAFDSEAVLNGIAWDRKRDVFYVTGKRWPWLFALRLKQRPPMPSAREQAPSAIAQ